MMPDRLTGPADFARDFCSRSSRPWSRYGLHGRRGRLREREKLRLGRRPVRCGNQHQRPARAPYVLVRELIEDLAYCPARRALEENGHGGIRLKESRRVGRPSLRKHSTVKECTCAPCGWQASSWGAMDRRLVHFPAVTLDHPCLGSNPLHPAVGAWKAPTACPPGPLSCLPHRQAVRAAAARPGPGLPWFARRS
jgi:hypothetical protein